MEASELRELIERGTAADRAFADGVIRMKRGAFVELHRRLRERADEAQAELRTRIAGGLRGAELRRIIEGAEDRDHFVEEMLGIAYPPLDERAPGPEQIPYVPSGYDEIVHAFESVKLDATQRFLDIGSGLGKAVMLAELLAGATAAGVELDDVLDDEARRAARALGLRASFTCGDARTAPYPPTDVVFMYLPFTGTILETVLGRIDRLGVRFVCAGSVNLERHPTLRMVGEGRSWLRIYEATSSVTSPTS